MFPGEAFAVVKLAVDILAPSNRKYLWIHLTVIGSIMFGQLIIPDFVGAWYIMITRPQLIAAGARPCDARPALSPEFVPKNCDLLLETITGPARQQQYTDTGGRGTTTVTWEGGHWSRTDTSYPVTVLSMILPALAFATLLLAQVRRVRRTGAFWSWDLAKHSFDQFEQLILLYALPIIVTGALVTTFRG